MTIIEQKNIILINKKIIFTRHAKSRMRERGISQTEVKEAIKTPGSTFRGRKGDLNVIKEFDKERRIRVVYVIENEQLIIITAIVLQ